jgi:uncharacterized protein YdeI (YjbR/CyaY-like superfamily)
MTKPVMTKGAKNPKVDFFFEQDGKWRAAFRKLRTIILDCGLDEDLKWGQACYSLDGRNVLLIHGFKDYCAMLFMKGALLKDPSGILVQQTENVQSARQIRFTSAEEVGRMDNMLKDYVQRAIEAEQAGLKVKMKPTAEFKMPEEFAARLAKKPALKKAFEALTPGRQRAYLLHFSSAKQSKTREARIDKCAPQILAGKGLMD